MNIIEEKKQPKRRKLGISSRWRPKIFAEVLGQEVPCQVLKKSVEKNLIRTAYLLVGMRGTGKTSLARIFAKALNCENFDGSKEPCTECISCQEIESGSSLHVIEIDGASHRGIDDVRSLIETCQYSPSSRGFRIYIIDEVHMLTKEAFNALLKTLEEPPLHVVFILATTDFPKVPNTISSRCMQLWFSAISQELIANKITMLLEATLDKVFFDAEVPNLIADLSEGSLRDAETLLEQLLAFCDQNLTQKKVYEVLGIPQKELFLELDQAILSKDLSSALRIGDMLFFQSQSAQLLLKKLMKHYQDHAFAMALPNKTALKEHYKYRTEHFLTLNREWNPKNLTYILEKIRAAVPILDFSPHLIVRALIWELVQTKDQVELSDVLARIENITFSEESTPSCDVPYVKETAIPTVSLDKEETSYSLPTQINTDDFFSDEGKRKLARMENVIYFMAKEAHASISVEKKA